MIYEPNERTDSTDSKQFIERLITKEVDLLLFAGGDGTARVVAKTLRDALPVIGIPTGVKIHSPVYAVSPEDAGTLALKFLTTSTLSVQEKRLSILKKKPFDEIRSKQKFMGI